MKTLYEFWMQGGVRVEVEFDEIPDRVGAKVKGRVVRVRREVVEE